MPTGQSVHYVSGGPDNMGLPTARPDRRSPVHEQRPRKPSGIDFAALAPICQGCGERSGSVQFASMLCRGCRIPATPTGADLARAERNSLIVAEYLGGGSLESVARRHHVAALTVRTALLAAGVAMRPRGRPKGSRPQPVAKVRAPRKAAPPRGIPVDEAAVVAEYEAGDSTPTIAARHGVRPKRIRKILTERRVTLRDDRSTRSGGRNARTLADYDPELVADILDRYGSGQPIATIAAEIGKGQHLVGIILHKAGVRLRLPANQPTFLDDDARAEMARQYVAGTSAIRIARAFRVSTDRCKTVIREQGVEIRRPGRPAAS